MRSTVLFGLLLLFGAVAPAAYGQIEVRLPVMAASPGEFVKLPVTVSEFGSIPIHAYEFTLHYDPEVLEIEGAEIAGTLSEDGMQIANAKTPGQFRFAFASVSQLGGDGLLLVLTGRALVDGGSPLHFESFLFNEGDPEPLAIDGRLIVGNDASAPDSSSTRDTTMSPHGR